MKLIIFFALCTLISAMVINEPCKTDAYPPPKETKINSVVLNLNDPPFDRWTHIVGPKSEELADLIASIKELVPTKVIQLVDGALGDIIDWLPYPYSDEIKGIAKATGLPLGEAVLYNIFYEIFTACTSIVGHDDKGKMYHSRNLDFGLLLGWDRQNDTWLVTEKLRKLIVNVDYQKNGVTVFKATHFVGYIGILTAVKPKMFTLTMNERFGLDGGYVGLIEWVLGLTKGKWMGFLLRDVMENATSYSQAKDTLTNTVLLAPAYFILGGTQENEACVITRSRNAADDVWNLNSTNGDWYLLETNYDHWKKPLFIDDRRTPGNKCMMKMGKSGMSIGGLFNVLSTPSSLNKLTAYTALMQVDDGVLETYLQNCRTPCWPW
ncbi:acid ceramidase isoform X2 [Hydra vulgaris]|uniref:Acid ceramidase n=1 Tax=Hydra vulgaris TaxID=6087 RepID=A0ABM4D3T4_HYDVU